MDTCLNDVRIIVYDNNKNVIVPIKAPTNTLGILHTNIGR
jgi:hypothetical protein